jgi:hypothetical protein
MLANVFSFSEISRERQKKRRSSRKKGKERRRKAFGCNQGKYITT